MNEKIIYSNNNYQIFENGLVAIDNNCIDYPKDIIRELANEVNLWKEQAYRKADKEYLIDDLQDEILETKRGYEAICKSFDMIRQENNRNRNALKRIKTIAEKANYVDDREAIADILNIFDELEKESENG